ncbi:fused response regulator/phosphatase, partial [Streptomyces albidoflavus]
MNPLNGTGPVGGSLRAVDAVLLLVEDDPGDALLLEETLADSDLDAELVSVRTLAEAQSYLAGCDRLVCVLLDLHLP